MLETLPYAFKDSPKAYELKQTLRAKEPSIRNIITQMGDVLGMGRGVVFGKEFDPVTAEPTGQGLCVLTAKITESAFRVKYPELIIGTTLIEVATFDAPVKKIPDKFFMDHAINPFHFPDEETLFLDMTFGQINPLLNRIVLDKVSSWNNYYPNLGIYGDLPPAPVSEWLRKYHKIAEKVSKPLSESDKRQLKECADEMESLLAA